ncbi:MAG TPA: hypothetical protein DDZ41_07900 [Flavobacterium sp.]|nr:hypothetical protein [Flavobacterium sp.]
MPAIYFPIQFEDKVNSPELLAFMQQFGEQNYVDAELINLFRDAINELHTLINSEDFTPENVANKLNTEGGPPTINQLTADKYPSMLTMSRWLSGFLPTPSGFISLPVQPTDKLLISRLSGTNGLQEVEVKDVNNVNCIIDNTYAQTTTNSVYVLLKEYNLNKLIDFKAIEYSAIFKTTGNNGDLLMRIVDSTNTLIYNVDFSVPNPNSLLALNHFNLRIDSTNNKLIYIATNASSDIGLMSSSQLIKVTINPNENYRFQILVRTLGTNPMSVENVLIKMYK